MCSTTKQRATYNNSPEKNTHIKTNSLQKTVSERSAQLIRMNFIMCTNTSHPLQTLFYFARVFLSSFVVCCLIQSIYNQTRKRISIINPFDSNKAFFQRNHLKRWNGYFLALLQPKSTTRVDCCWNIFSEWVFRMHCNFKFHWMTE